MFIVREVTDLVDDFESLVTGTDNQDYIDDQEQELLEFVGDAFYADGRHRWDVIEDVQLHAERLGIRVVRGRVSLLIADKCAEDGEVILKRVYVPRVD